MGIFLEKLSWLSKDNRQVTKRELLLAIAMSSLYRKSHVLFLPPNTNYLSTLRILQNKKYIEPVGESFYGVTKKGFNFIKRQDITGIKSLDNEIDKWVDKL